MAVTAPGRRADGDEYRVRPVDSRIQVTGEGQPSGGDVPGHQHIKAGFVDRHVSAQKHFHLARVLVDAGHFMSEV